MMHWLLSVLHDTTAMPCGGNQCEMQHTTQQSTLWHNHPANGSRQASCTLPS